MKKTVLRKANDGVVEYERGLTYQELAALTGYTVSWLKKAKRELGCPCFKNGQVVRFRISEFKRWEQLFHNPGLLKAAQ